MFCRQGTGTTPTSSVPGDCLAVDLGAGDDRAPRESDDWFGGTGDCVIRGGLGDDVISWSGYDGAEGPHETTLSGGAGADELWGGYNDDILLGGPGDDAIHASEALWGRPDLVVAGRGDDLIVFDETPDGGPVDCGPGQDQVQGVALPRELIDCEVVNPEPVPVP
jgi:Ca2+-binding RTX toxin-like protein